MSQVLWTPVAESDLDDILFYIAFVDRNPITGERIYHELQNRFAEHIARDRPGHRHLDAPDDWLYMRFKRWLVFCRAHPVGVEVMRVVDATRDLPRGLRGESGTR